MERGGGGGGGSVCVPEQGQLFCHLTLARLRLEVVNTDMHGTRARHACVALHGIQLYVRVSQVRVKPPTVGSPWSCSGWHLCVGARQEGVANDDYPREEDVIGRMSTPHENPQLLKRGNKKLISGSK